MSLKVITNNNNNNNVGLTPDLSTRLMELLTDYHQAVTVWLSPACYALVILYFSIVFAIYVLCEFSSFWRGAAETFALLGYCALSPSVCCLNVQGRIFHWIQKSEYLDLHVLICKYLPLLLTCALFVQTVKARCHGDSLRAASASGK